MENTLFGARNHVQYILYYLRSGPKIGTRYSRQTGGTVVEWASVANETSAQLYGEIRLGNIYEIHQTVST